MNTQLAQLKEIVLADGYDDESRQAVATLEKRLQESVQAEKLLDHPVIRKYLDLLDHRRRQAEHLLKTDRTLDDRQRDKLFERIDSCDEFTTLFDGSNRAEIEDEITELLLITKE